MKSERRHELQENDLGKLTLKLGKYFEESGNQILLGLAAVLLVAGAVIWSVRSSNAAKQEGWTAYNAANSAEQFDSVAESYAGTDVGDWARLSAAESHLESGIEMSFADRTAAIDELETSQKFFEKLLGDKDNSVSTAVRERALIGMARYLEVTSDGDNSEAIDTYERFITEFPDSIYKDLAQSRADALSTGSAQEFYAWFHKQNPKPEDRAFPQDGLPAGHPELNPFGGSMTDSFFEPAPTGLDRWISPEAVPDLLTVPEMDEEGAELSFPPEPDADNPTNEDSSKTDGDGKKDG